MSLTEIAREKAFAVADHRIKQSKEFYDYLLVQQPKELAEFTKDQADKLKEAKRQVITEIKKFQSLDGYEITDPEERRRPITDEDKQEKIDLLASLKS